MVRLAGVWIKAFAEQQVQPMNGEGELPKEILGRASIKFGEVGSCGGVGLHPLAHPTKTKGQRFVRVVVAELRQQTSNRGGTATGASDQAKCFRGGLFFPTNPLEEAAFELTAIRGSIRINLAPAAGA